MPRQVFDDDDAMAAMDSDIRRVGPYRLGRDAALALGERGRNAVRDILDEDDKRAELGRRMNLTDGAEVLQAYWLGFIEGCRRAAGGARDRAEKPTLCEVPRARLK